MTPNTPAPINSVPCDNCAGSGRVQPSFWKSATWKYMRRTILVGIGALGVTTGNTVCPSIQNPFGIALCKVVFSTAAQAANQQVKLDTTIDQLAGAACPPGSLAVKHVWPDGTEQVRCVVDAMPPDGGVDIIPMTFHPAPRVQPHGQQREWWQL